MTKRATLGRPTNKHLKNGSWNRTGDADSDTAGEMIDGVRDLLI